MLFYHFCIFDWQINKQQIVSVRFEAMFHANAGTVIVKDEIQGKTRERRAGGAV